MSSASSHSVVYQFGVSTAGKIRFFSVSQLRLTMTALYQNESFVLFLHNKEQALILRTKWDHFGVIEPKPTLYSITELLEGLLKIVIKRQIGAASCSQALVHMGDFKDPNICWRNNTEGHKQCGRFWSALAAASDTYTKVNKERCCAECYTYHMDTQIYMYIYTTVSDHIWWWRSQSWEEGKG